METRFKNRQIVPKGYKDDKKMSSPWLSYHRKVHQEGKDIFVLQELKFFKKIITKEELQSSEFKKSQEMLRNDLEDLAIIYQ